MREYNVEQALEKLKLYKITTHKESLRRWLRNGTIKGIAPASRKKGWRIKEQDLWTFIEQRMPEEGIQNPFTTNVVKGGDDREFYRSEMWWEMARKNLFEGTIEVQKSDIHACMKAKNYSDKFEEYVWKRINEHTWQAKPRIFYLHDAFLFNSQRIRMDPTFKQAKEQILYALVEHLRKKE